MDYFRTTTINIEPIDLGPPYFTPERFNELPHTPYPAETSWLRSVLDLESLDSDDSGDDGSEDSDSGNDRSEDNDSDNDGSEDSSSETDDSDDSDSGGENCDNEVSDDEFFDDEVLDDEKNDNDVSDENLENEGEIRGEECETDCEGPETYLGEIVTDVVGEVAQSNDEESHVEGYRYADCWAREIEDEFLNSDSGEFDSLSAEDLEKVMEYLP